MAKRRASLTKTAAATATKSKVGESLSIQKQEEIIQKANQTSVSSQKGSTKAVQRLTIDIPIEIHQKLKRVKDEQGITSKGLIVNLLREHFSNASV